MQRSETLLIFICLAHCLSLLVDAADAVFSIHNGYIAGGSDIENVYTTVTEAKAHCLKLAECRGFTFMGAPSEGPMWINFKSEWNVAGDGWTSYRREFEAPVPPELPLASATMESEGAADVSPDAKPGQIAKDTSKADDPEARLVANASSSVVTEKPAQSAGSTPSIETKEAATTELEVAPEEETAKHDFADMASVRNDTHEQAAVEAAASESVPLSMAQPTSSVEASPVASAGPEMDRTSEIPADGLLRARVRPAAAVPAQPSNYSKGLFVGRLMAMTQRAVVGLSKDLVVFCYASAEVGGACMAGNASAMSTEASLEDARLLSPVPWGDAEVFLASETGRLEIVRLTPVRFAVCFERVSDSSVHCSPGIVQGGDVDNTFRCTFGTSILVGIGALVSASPSSAGQQLAACFAETRDRRVACRWAQVLQEQQIDTFELSWIDSEARVVKTV
jgi:hypothetical protein